jgi:tRNA(adenine34) deaminase
MNRHFTRNGKFVVVLSAIVPQSFRFARIPAANRKHHRCSGTASQLRSHPLRCADVFGLLGYPYSIRLCTMEKMADSLHESYMRLCLKLAGIARERGEVPVGSVIVRDGAVIAEGIEGVRAQLDVAHHAEMEAIRRTCQILQTLDLSECTLYTSAEPCFMCSYAIRACRISTVVFGAPVNAVGGSSSHFPVLSTSAVPSWGPPPKIVQGILSEECEATRNIPQHIPKL